MMENVNNEWQVILNPHAGCGKGLRDRHQIEAILKKSGIPCRLHLSEYPGHAIILAKELAAQGNLHYIIAGGDGTLNEVVNGIFQLNHAISDKVIMGMIPVGTGNDWIKTFGIPDDYQQAMNIILENKTVWQDVGEISFCNELTETRRYFVNIAGFGFDAVVAGRANQLKQKGIKGFRVYIESLLSSYFCFTPCFTDISIDSTPIRPNLFSASIGIGKYNGGGMMQVPEANPTEGKFHITVISKIGIWGILKNLAGLYNGTFIRDRRVTTYAGKEIEIKSEKPLPCEADGESLGESSYRIRILPHKLQVICGRTEF